MEDKLAALIARQSSTAGPIGGKPEHNLTASPRQIAMIIMGRCGSIGRNTSGGTAGAAGAAATAAGPRPEAGQRPSEPSPVSEPEVC
jgi:hypothetical protein